MPTKRLTDRGIKAAKAPDSAYVDWWDAGLRGFGVRISPHGHKSFHCMRRVGPSGPVRRIKIGNHPDISLADARAMAKVKLSELAAGNDPKAEAAKRAKQAEAADRRRFEVVAEAFIQDHAAKLRSAKEVERVVRYDLIPAFGDKSIDQITRGDVREWLRMKTKTAPTMANRALAHLKTLFNFAVDFEWIDSNPATRVKPLAATVKRERILSDDELLAVWQATSKLNKRDSLDPLGPLVRMLILTCQRRDEVAGMTRQEIDLGNAAWTIPPDRSKSKSGHRVPLSRPAVKLLTNLSERVGFESFSHVFATGYADDKAPSGFSHMKSRLDKLSGVTDWRLHDLRRTGATGMRSLGVARETVGLVLNHTPTGITATVYDKYAEDPEKRRALERWGAHVLRLTKGKQPTKVVQLAS